ncbi:MAG: FUSC family protein, partial [Sarcina sp.]
MFELQKHVHIKNYISWQTLSIFLMGCLFIVVAIYGLGTPNMMVGGFGIFLLKAIVNKDFSSKPLTSIINITVYTLFIGILPFIVNLNVYTGLIINFVAIFLLLYMLVYSLKETIYIPFLLGYAFFLNSPATGKYFTLRVFGLIFIAVVAVIYQIVYYKLKGSESLACNNINKSFFLLSKLASDKKYDSASFDESIKALEKHNLKWNSDILNNKKNTFYFTKDENIQLNLVSSIRTLKFRISDLTSDGRDILDDIIPLITNLRNFNKGSYKRYLLIEDFSYFNNKYKHDLPTEIYEIKESLNIIFALLINFYDIRKGVVKVSNRSKLRDYIDLEKNLFKDFRRGSSRFTFAFRTALLISLSYFFITLFHIEMGKWIIFTIVSISQPYYDVTKQKAFQRLRGTIIGGVIFTILGLMFTTFNERLIIIFIAIYFVIAFTDYSKRITAA